MRSRLTRYLLTLILPAGLLCLIFVYSLYHEERTMVRQNLEAAEELRLLAGARSAGRRYRHGRQRRSTNGQPAQHAGLSRGG